MELKRHIVKGETYNGEEICGGFAYYDADEVDAVLAEKDAIIKNLDSLRESHVEYCIEQRKEIRRLKRALYKACANWAHHRVFVRFNTNEKRWENMERKCRAMAERFGEGK